jgi:chromosome segregation ATPase
MSSSENDQQTELLKGIAASLKGIHSSLESLTAAVEDVSESIEKAHEPEGDLGVHLVGALKDLVSALHKKANQERSAHPQQNPQRHQQQSRRDHQKPRQDDPVHRHEGHDGESDQEETGRTGPEKPDESEESVNQSATETQSAMPVVNKRRRPRGRRSGKAPADKA